MSRDTGNKLISRQWLFYAITVALIALTLGLYLFREHERTAKREETRLLHQAHLIRKNIDWNLESLNNILSNLQKDTSVISGDQGYNQRLSNLVSAMPGVRTMLTLDTEGFCRLSDKVELLGKNFRERDYFKIPQQQNEDMLYVSPPFKTSLNTFVINASKILRSSDGTFAGIVAASLDPDYFSTLLESVRYSPDMISALAHGDGLLFLMAPKKPDLAGKNLAVPGSFFNRHQTSGKVQTVHTGTVYATGRKQMMAQATIQATAFKMNKPLVVAVSRDLEAVFAEWRREAATLISLFLIFVTLAGIGLRLYMNRRNELEHQKTESETNIRRLNEELDRFFSMALDMLCIADSEGNFKRLNLSWSEVLGYNLEELIGQKFLAYVHPDDIPATLAAMADLNADKSVFNFINRYRHKDGSYRWIEWRSTPCQNLIYAAARDITERKNAEAALHAALTDAERFREALDHVSSYIYMKDRNHRYVYANQPTLNLFGVTADELIGSEDSRFFPPATVTRLLEVDNRVFSGERTSLEIDVADAPDGRRVYWEVKTPIYEDADKSTIWGLCGISTDISELKQAQLQLEQLNEELRKRTAEAESANRAKSEFLANMSHEIRTPMNAILGLTRIVLDMELTDRQADLLRKVYRSSQALMVILNDILDYSKIEAGRLEIESLPISVADILHDTMELFNARLEEKGLAILLDLDPKLPEIVMGDPLRISQILNNLVGNAIKFTETGEIEIRTELAADDPETLYLRFAVRDTGIGLSKEQSERLFQAFTQADGTISRKYGGTGLGLTISQRLVRLMGGDIDVSSVEGTGATFSFVIQVGKAPPGAQAARKHHQKPESNIVDIASKSAPTVLKTGSGLLGVRILLVEDNRINQEVAAEFLRKQGAVVTLAVHGAEALDLIKRPCFDVVLMDLHMPVMDGFEATRKIREFHGNNNLPIIAMTAAVMQDDRERCTVAGMVDFVAKPIDPDELTFTLQKWLKQPKIVPAVPVGAAIQPDKPLTLESMPGFDSATALRRMSGNKELLQSLLLEFAHEHATASDTLSSLLSTGNPDEALHLIHTIKGVAGTIGAVALAEAAAALEHELRANTAPSSLQRFEQELAAAVSVIQATLH